MVIEHGIVCFAYPTLGKTTYKNKHKDFSFDFDFGSFIGSIADEWTPEIKKEFLPIYSALCDKYLETAAEVSSLKKVVFINEIKHASLDVIQRVAKKSTLVMLIPNYDNKAFYERFRQRAALMTSKDAANHLHWAKKLAAGFDKDMFILKSFAIKHHITYSEVEYVEDYLSTLIL